MICKRCCGSGILLRPKKDIPIIKSFRVCTTCGGKGTSHVPFGPKQYEVGTKGFYLYPQIND